MLAANELMQLLKAELTYLENGGYRGSPGNPWRPNFVFEDSPTCINFHSQVQPKPCSECALMAFVPEDRRRTKFPCRHIPLTELGETVSSFYECGTQEELEAALGRWLRRHIEVLEEETQGPQSNCLKFRTIQQKTNATMEPGEKFSVSRPVHNKPHFHASERNAFHAELYREVSHSGSR